MWGRGSFPQRSPASPDSQLPSQGRAVSFGLCQAPPPCFHSRWECWGVQGRILIACAVIPQGRLFVCSPQPPCLGRSPQQEGAACPTRGCRAVPWAPLQAWLLGSPALGELWALSSFPSALRKGELGSQRDRKGSHRPNPDKVTCRPLHPTARGGAGDQGPGLRGGGFVLKAVILGTPFRFSPGAEESPLSLRKRRWILAPSPKAPHLLRVSSLPRLPPSLSHSPSASRSCSRPEPPETPARRSAAVACGPSDPHPLRTEAGSQLQPHRGE